MSRARPQSITHLRANPYTSYAQYVHIRWQQFLQLDRSPGRTLPNSVRTTAIDRLEAAIPQMQQEFVMRGPLRGFLPADLRADIIRVFTQVLCRAIRASDGAELGQFVDSVVWEAHKLGVSPLIFLEWIDQYTKQTRELLEDKQWTVAEPVLGIARQHIERLQN